MIRRVLPLSLLILALAILSACGNGIDKLPGASSGAVTVQFAQAPPTPTIGGQAVGLVANALNDNSNKGVTWSCTPVGACGTFNPATTLYNVGTLYTPPVAPANGPITPNLSYSVTVTATSVADSSKSVSNTFNVAQQYAFILAGNGSFGMVGSVTLDGNGNIIGGEADASANGFYSTVPSLTGTYALDSSGHGFLSLSLNNTSCCGTFQQTQGITATSNSHLVIAEEDQFNGLTIGGVGSMDLQAGPFSAAQVSSGYSFTLAGYSGANSANASWGGIFTADGLGALSGGIFDENLGGGTGYSSVPFTGTFTAPDANGRGTLTLGATPDSPTKSTQYAYYIVTPEVIRLTSITNTSSAGNTGSAYGQGVVGTTNSALNGSYIFSGFGFTSDSNGGESGAEAGQFTADGGGSVTAGVVDVNAFGTVTTSSLAGSTYAIAASPRGTLTASSGQTYNVYLTDPNLNLLDPNNPAGGGGALLLETDVADMVGLAIPQTDTSGTLTGAYGILLSDQNNLGGCCNYDGGYTGQLTVSTSPAGTYSGEGDFQGQGSSNATPIVGPLSGTFSADGANPGRFTGSITTAPAFPLAPVGNTTPGTENVSYYMANSSTGFIVETDSTAPVFGFVETQGTIQSAQKRNSFLHQHPANTNVRPTNSGLKQLEISRRSR